MLLIVSISSLFVLTWPFSKEVTLPSTSEINPTTVLPSATVPILASITWSAVSRASASSSIKPTTLAISELTVPFKAETTPSKASTSFCALSAASWAVVIFPSNTKSAASRSETSLVIKPRTSVSSYAAAITSPFQDLC